MDGILSHCKEVLDIVIVYLDVYHAFRGFRTRELLKGPCLDVPYLANALDGLGS